jgi:hypothetical protein
VWPLRKNCHHGVKLPNLNWLYAFLRPEEKGTSVKEAIWQSYGEDILEMHKIRQLEKQASDELEDFNDETPF